MTRPTVEQLVDQMTLEEQVSILSGEDFWSTPAVPRLGIRKMHVSDGPNGARGGGSLIGGVKSACFPCGIAIGATWNPDLAADIGRALAAEVKSKGAHVLLAPTVNIHRSVTNGRNFECYSEDPELSAALAVGYITGLQSEGVSATIKHYAGNESEIERTTISSDVEERPLREIYLRPFEDAVKKADTWAIMSSYNKLNGTYTAENHWLLTDVLRGDWGYDGVVMSDWFGSRSTAPTVNAGLDLEMPGPARDRGAKLVAAVEAGEVSRDTVRTRALNMLRMMERCGSLWDETPFAERADDRPETRALIRRAGAEGTVLLKNDGTLPLAEGSRLAVIGPNAKVAQIMGGGSAQLNPHYRVSPFEGLTSRVGAEAITFAPGCDNHRWEALIEGDFTVDFYANTSWSGEPVHSEKMDSIMSFWFPPFAGNKVDPAAFSARIKGSYTPVASGLHRIGAHAAGYARVLVDGKLVLDCGADKWVKGRTFFEEGNDEITADLDLTAGQPIQIEVEFQSKKADNLIFNALRVGIGRPLGDADIAEAAKVAAAADTAIVFVGRSGEWDTEGSDLENITLPGRQNELVAAVAAANPRTVVVLQTGGPVEMPWINDVAAVMQSWYPGQEAGNAIADVLYGDAEPSGRLSQSFPVRFSDNPAHSQDPLVYPGLDGHVRYDEGVFIGHRHYDARGIDPLFAFGYGLGYTTFELSDLTASPDGISVTVTNTGERAGSTVVQVYVGEDAPVVDRPIRELKGFAKVKVDPGQSTRVQIALPDRAYAYWDTDTRCWRINGGKFTISVGQSSRDLPLTATVTRNGMTIPA